MKDRTLQAFKNREVKAKDIFEIRKISKELSYDFIRKYHYLADAKFFSEYSFGLFCDNELVGCATFSQPQGNVSLMGWFGLDNYNKDIMELSRLYMLPNLNGTNATSYLLGNSIKKLKSFGIRAVITLADSGRHIGSIYQVCNFKYYGLTDKKCDFYRDDGAVNPRGRVSNWHGVWIDRTRKHRYAFILDKKLKCLYEEQSHPTEKKAINTECCGGNLLVHDNRFDEWFTCPKCCKMFIKIDNKMVDNILKSNNKEDLVCEEIRKFMQNNNIIDEAHKEELF